MIKNESYSFFAITFFMHKISKNANDKIKGVIWKNYLQFVLVFV